MSPDETKPRMKPLFLVKPGSISRRDINRAEKLSCLCIVECSAPDEARFLEPGPEANLDTQARAALSLMRWVTTIGTATSTFYKGDIMKVFVDALINAPRPKAVAGVKAVKK